MFPAEGDRRPLLDPFGAMGNRNNHELIKGWKDDRSRHERCVGDATVWMQINAIDGEVAFAGEKIGISLKKESEVNRSWAAGVAN
jgi:hypothetical protein